MVAYSYYPMDQRVRREAEVLKERGALVHVISLRAEGEKGTETSDGITVFRVPQGLRRSGGYFRYLVRYLSFLLLSKCMLIRLHTKNRYNVVHVHSIPDFLVFSAFISRLMGSKVVLDLHEGMPEVFSSRFGVSMDSWAVGLARVAEKVSVRFADLTITTSANRKKLIGARTRTGNVEVIMNLPKRETFRTRDMTDFIGKHNLDGKFIVSYIGGLNPERELDVVINAIKSAEGRIPGIRFIFCGTGEDEYVASLKSLISKLDLQEKVIFLGYVPQSDVLNYVGISNVALSPYKLHPNLNPVGSTKIFEYLMVPRPVIAADYPGNREEFADMVLYYRSSDPASLADMILEVYGNEGKYMDMARRAQDEVFKRYDPAENERKLVAIYRNLSGRHRLSRQ